MKTKTARKRTAKQTARPKPFLNAAEIEQLEHLPGGIGEVLEAAHCLAEQNHEKSDEHFKDLWTMIAFSWMWCEVYDDERRQNLYCFIQDLMNVMDKSKTHIPQLENIDFEEMDVYYLVP